MIGLVLFVEARRDVLCHERNAVTATDGHRLVLARAFFSAGQAKVDGPVIALGVFGWNGGVTLPMSVKDTTYQMFDQLAALPLPSSAVAPVVGAIEFVIPICLVLGLGTRFCAIVLLAMTAVIQWVTGFAQFWTLHVYWISILLVLISLGPGLISVDHDKQLYREYVRYLLSRSEPRLPAWVEEGLSQIIMRMEFDKRWIVFAKLEDPNTVSAQAAMVSSKFLYVVGSPSPEKAMSFKRRR